MLVNLSLKETRDKITEWNYDHGLGLKEHAPGPETGPRATHLYLWYAGNSHIVILPEGTLTDVRFGDMRSTEPANAVAVRAWDKLEKLLQPFTGGTEPEAPPPYSLLTFDEAKQAVDEVIVESGYTNLGDHVAYQVGDRLTYGFFYEVWLFYQIELYRRSADGAWGMREKLIKPTDYDNRLRMKVHLQGIDGKTGQYPTSGPIRPGEPPVLDDKSRALAQNLRRAWDRMVATKTREERKLSFRVNMPLAAFRENREKWAGIDAFENHSPETPFGATPDDPPDALPGAIPQGYVKYIPGDEDTTRVYVRFRKSPAGSDWADGWLTGIWREFPSARPDLRAAVGDPELAQLLPRLAREAEAAGSAPVATAGDFDALGARAQRLGIRPGRLARWDKIRQVYRPRGLTQAEIAALESVSEATIKLDFKDMRKRKLIE